MKNVPLDADIGLLKNRLIYLAGISVCSLISTPVIAADWTLEKGIQLGVLHSDNVAQSPSDTGQRSANVGQFKPKISLFGNGNSANVLLLSEVEYLKSDVQSDATVYPRVYGSVNSTLVENLVYLDSDVLASRIPDGPVNPVLDPLSLSDDLANTVRVNVNPRIEINLQDLAEFRFKYGFNSFTTESNEFRDSQTNQFSVDLETDRSSAGYQFGTQYEYTQTDFSRGEPLIERSATVTAEKTLVPGWLLSASVGREWAEIPDQSEGNTSALAATVENGAIWDVGLTWRPQDRTSVFAGYGRRFFGGKPVVELTHRMRHSTFSVEWSRELTRSKAVLPSLDVTGLADEVADDSSSDLPDELLSSPDDSVTVNEIGIEEMLRAEYRLLGRISELQLEALYSKREERFQALQTTDSSVVLRSVLTRRLNQEASLSFSYDHSRGLTGSLYRENRLGVSLTLNFR